MWFTARETVAMETPARLATSRMLAAPDRRRSEELFLEALTGENDNTLSCCFSHAFDPEEKAQEV
jgi:hypothetical protein